MILAYHSIFSAYGFWLPNDPRGSWSDFVRQWELVRFGKATKTSARHSLARAPHEVAARRAAKEALRYPPVSFSGLQARSIAGGFAQAAGESSYHIHACSILPEHVHVVVARHRLRIERIVGHLKARATHCLRCDGLHPLAAWAGADAAAPSPWGRLGWHVYLDDPRDVARAIGYVRDNPAKEGKRRQNWSFVTPFGA